MKIFQTTPRLVFLSDNKVYKFFSSRDEFLEEKKALESSPLSKLFDKKSEYTIKLISVLEFCDIYYVMEYAEGENLSNSNILEDYYLAGRWLNCFHKLSFDSNNKTVFLFGDFTKSHLYINRNKKEIIAIDPGNGFGTVDKFEYDLSRFIINLIQCHSLNLKELWEKVSFFLSGYNSDCLDIEVLQKLLLFRIKRNFDKNINLRKDFKRFFSSTYWLIQSSLKLKYINYKLNRMK